jgi:restriction system protein
MPVPDFQSLMRPVLDVLEDGAEHSIKSIQAAIAGRYALTPEEKQQMLPGGTGTVLASRVGWAATYLYQTKLLDRPRRGVYRITDRGRTVFAANPERVDLKTLDQFPELREFRKGKKPAGGGDAVPVPPVVDETTPEERIDGAYHELRSALASELLDLVLEQAPEFFERLVLDVLHAMGYGGSRDETTEHLGQSGDEGVDGVIREDQLGLDRIYVQAKRWKVDRTVGRKDIQEFVGALQGKHGTKGVFLTTSTFSSGAVEYADSVTPRISLVDGLELSELMTDHGVGVSVSRSYDLRRVDRDYFPSDDDVAVEQAGSQQA